MKLERVSASQIALYLECPRKWFYRYVLKKPIPETAAMLRGTAIHEITENYTKTGELTGDPDLVRMVEPVLELMPKRGPELLVEQEFSLPTYPGGPSLIGFVDLFDPRGHRKNIIDFKTTSDARYTKSSDELRHNLQMLVYAFWAFSWLKGVGACDEIEVTHLYIFTRGKPKASKSFAVVTRKEVQDYWDKLMVTVRAMDALALAEPKPDDVEPNTDACMNFGGCHFRPECGLSITKRMGAAGGTAMANGKSLDQMLADKRAALAAAAQAKPAPAPEPEAGLVPPDAPPRDGVKNGEAPVEAEAPKTDTLPAEAPKKRGRPKKSATTTDAPPAEPASDVTETVAESEPPPAAVATSVAQKRDLTLYVDCIPMKGAHRDSVVMFEDWAKPICEHVAEENGILDMRLIDFGKWKGPFAVAIKASLDALPKAMIVSSFATGAHEALDVLIPHAANVVRALRG